VIVEFTLHRDGEQVGTGWRNENTGRAQLMLPQPDGGVAPLDGTWTDLSSRMDALAVETVDQP
jgi:hypothetical protein